MGITYHLIYVSMGMTINPIVYATISNEVSKFRSEGSIYRTSYEIW